MARHRVALVQRVVPHYNLVFYRKLLATSRHDWEFLYGPHPGGEESGLATEAEQVLPTRRIHNVAIGSAIWQRDVTRWLRSQRYAATLIEVGWQILSNAVVPPVAHRVRTAVIPWAKGISESGEPRPKWRQWLERRFTHQCDAIVAYGQVTVDYFQAYGYPRERMFIAQNTVDVRQIVDRIPDDRPRAEALRRALGLEGGIVVGYFGRLVPQKHVDWIIEAFDRARSAGIGGHLVIAGDGPARASLEALAGRLGSSTAIRFCGRVPEQDAGMYFELFDVFVSASSAGLAILEAMAHAKIALITPEARPETELVRDGVTGIVTRGYSVADLAEGLGRAAAALRGRQALGETAQRAVLERATLENMVEAFDRAVDCGIAYRNSR